MVSSRNYRPRSGSLDRVVTRRWRTPGRRLRINSPSLIPQIFLDLDSQHRPHLLILNCLIDPKGYGEDGGNLPGYTHYPHHLIFIYLRRSSLSHRAIASSTPPPRHTERLVKAASPPSHQSPASATAASVAHSTRSSVEINHIKGLSHK